MSKGKASVNALCVSCSNLILHEVLTVVRLGSSLPSDGRTDWLFWWVYSCAVLVAAWLHRSLYFYQNCLQGCFGRHSDFFTRIILTAKTPNFLYNIQLHGH